MNLNVPAVNTTKYGLMSISYSCAKMWNSLISKWKMKQCTSLFAVIVL